MNYKTAPTDYEFKKALQALTETSIPQGSSTNLNSTMCSPGSGSASSGKPQHISEIPLGVKFGYINRIDLNANTEYKYEVIFPDTRTKAWARKYGKNGETNTPDGQIKNGILYPTNKINVGAQIEYQSFSWVIIVEEEPPLNLTPGTKTFTIGNSKITFFKDSLKLECGNSNITITNDEINISSSSVKINGVEHD